MSDRELIRLAAKAAEVNGPQVQGFDGIVIGNERDGHIFWNPLTDDGDALRLAVKLGLRVHIREAFVSVDMYEEGVWVGEIQVGTTDSTWNDEPRAATRRAIVRAAAEIGQHHDENT